MSDFDRDIDLCMSSCLDYFGNTVTYIPKESGTEYHLSGIFDENVDILDTSGEVPVETPMPVLSLKISDFKEKGIREPEQDDKFIINGKHYIVARKEKDGHSEIRLILFKGGEIC